MVLISGLADAPSDISELAETLVGYARDGIALRVVGLAPARGDRRFFERGAGGASRVTEANDFAATRGVTRSRWSGAFPWSLFGVGLLVVLLVALNERLCGALRWSARAAAREERAS